jgi:hypothetical protein
MLVKPAAPPAEPASKPEPAVVMSSPPVPVESLPPQTLSSAPDGSKRSDLKNSVRKIITLAKSGDTEGAYVEYARLFSSPTFHENRPEERRVALKLLVLAKPPPTISESLQGAYLCALSCIQTLVEQGGEPSDYELLGACQKALGREGAARESFAMGLAAERARNPSSEVCGSLMRRMSEL